MTKQIYFFSEVNTLSEFYLLTMFNQAADCDKSSNQDSNNTARDKSNCKDKKCIFCDIVKKEADATIVCEVNFEMTK